MSGRERSNVLLSVRDVVKTFQRRRVLDGVFLDVRAGEVVALVGESGSGKSTLARLLAGLDRADAGQIQDPFASLNPVHTVEHHLCRPLARRHRAPTSELRARAAQLLADVGLDRELAARHPHALSGGQRQRVAVARALAAEPDVILADEPTSMLDVSTRLGVLKLLRRLADERRLAILLITHDLAAAHAIADRVLTLYAGRIVESGPTATVLRAPAHPYTRLLLSSVPRGERLQAAAPTVARSADVAAEPAVAAPLAQGCPFLTRCPRAIERCHQQPPEARLVTIDHEVRCHLFPVKGASEHAALS
jgi:peptide/nickel transport system ATP-binding protein